MDNLWLARDSKGNLSLFNKKPIKKEYTFNGEKITYFTIDDSDFNELDLNKDWYPHITYENSPIQCSLMCFDENTPDWVMNQENCQGVFRFVPYDTDSFYLYIKHYKDFDDYEKGKTYVFENPDGSQFLDKCIANHPDLPAIFENNTTPGVGCEVLGEYIDEEFKYE
jgi:hypothetical protein